MTAPSNSSILCVSVNPAIDKQLRVSSLAPGRVNRASAAAPAPGGKALHVATSLQALGSHPQWLGFAGGPAGAELLSGIAELGITARSVATNGHTRTNLAILDDTGQITELLEPGPTISAAESSAFLAAMDELLASPSTARIVVISGSLAPGLPANFYAALLSKIHASGRKVLLDASGAAFCESLTSQPDFVKPNREEAAAIVGHSVDSTSAAASAAKVLLQRGCKSVAISLGKDGLLWATGPAGPIYFSPASGVAVRSTVGCGDATVAGFAHAFADGLGPEETMRFAVACGAANCLAEIPGRIDAARVRALIPEVKVVSLA